MRFPLVGPNCSKCLENGRDTETNCVTCAPLFGLNPAIVNCLNLVQLRIAPKPQNPKTPYILFRNFNDLIAVF